MNFRLSTIFLFLFSQSLYIELDDKNDIDNYDDSLEYTNDDSLEYTNDDSQDNSNSPNNQDNSNVLYFDGNEWIEGRIDQNQKLTLNDFRSKTAKELKLPSPEFESLHSAAGDSSAPATNLKANTSFENSTYPPFATKPLPPSKTLLNSILNIALVLIGIFTTFSGGKHFKLVLAFFGAALFSIATHLILLKVNHGTLSPGNWQIITIVSIAIGSLLGALLFAYLLNFVASILLGAFLGYVIGSFVFDIYIINVALKEIEIKISLILATTLLFLILAIFVKKTILILATAVFGSFCIFTGIDYFHFAGFVAILDLTKPSHFYDTFTYIYVGGFILIAAIGSAVQFQSARYENIQLLDGDQEEKGQKYSRLDSSLQKDAQRIKEKYRNLGSSTSNV